MKDGMEQGEMLPHLCEEEPAGRGFVVDRKRIVGVEAMHKEQP